MKNQLVIKQDALNIAKSRTLWSNLSAVNL